MLSVGGQAHRARVARTTSAALAVAGLLLAVVGAQRTAQAEEVHAALGANLSMADPGSYDHATGGGTWGDGPGGAAGDVWHEQQWPGAYECGDVVSFMLLVTSVNITGVGPAARTVEVDLAFDAATSGAPGAGFSEIVGASVQEDDPGATDDGDSSAAVLSAEVDGLHEEGGTLSGTVQVTGVEVGEHIVVRVDVRVTCAGAYTGSLEGRISGLREVAPDARELGAGENRTQLVQVSGEAVGPAEPPPTTTTTTAGTTTSTTPPSSTTTTEAEDDGPDVGGEGTSTSTTAPAATSTTSGQPGPSTTDEIEIENQLSAVSVLPSGPMSLPRTGGDPSGSLWWAAALVAAGLSLVTAARGRRQLDQLA